MPSTQDNGGGLSLQTLLIASLSSLAAALFIHKFWQAGAILGAAVTPVIVALVSEGLRKPAERITARTGRTRDLPAVNPPPVVDPPRDDRFGIWEQQKRRRPLHVKLAVATGVVAFLLAAVVLTGAELVLGGASDSDRLRVIPGKQERKDAGGGRERQEGTRTGPDQAVPTAPEDEEAPPATAPEEEAPPETAPEDAPPPEEEVPPAETLPQPAPGATTPAQP